MSESRAEDAVSNPASNLDAERVDEGWATPRARLELLAIALGASLGLWALYAAFGEQQIAFEDLALGAATDAYFAEVDGDPVHCVDLDDADGCLHGYTRRGGRPAVLWLGNSQLHAVNQYEQGQETATSLVHRRLEADGLDVLAFSLANATLQEHLVLYLWLAERVTLRALVLPMVFDDARETGVRASVARALDDPVVVTRLGVSEAGRHILAAQAATDGGDLAALEDTFQESTEAALVGWLDEHWTLWHQRPQARGSLMHSMFRLRNVVFGIDSTTARRAIPGRLLLNQAAAEAMLSDARERGVATVVYVAPLRGDVPPPYLATEYAQYRRDVAALAERHGARFGDLDALIPAEAWGRTPAMDFEGDLEIDFMHFRAEGHVLLAQAIERLVREALGDAT
jgi:hypothetical protein